MNAIATEELSVTPINTLEPQEASVELLRRAQSRAASDLFLYSNENSVVVAMRALGQIDMLSVVSRDQGRHLINYFKAQAGLDIAERRRPQEGRWLFQDGASRCDLRLNVVPTLFGEDVAVRILDRRLGVRPLVDLGLSQGDLALLTSLLASPSGLILVTGPTGSGKTTTLYACLQHLNRGTLKINTIEDPIEYAIAGVRQSQVNVKLGVDFPDLLRNILRQAPDVIMIGEIRDEDTAATAIRAANSGQLVLATLHAPRAAGAIQSLRALGGRPYFLSSGLLGVVAQRLVRTLCPNCRVAYDIRESPETFAEIRSLLEPGLGDFIHGPGSCEQCGGRGYNGRTGVFELMTFNRELRRMIFEQCSAPEIERVAIAHGMVEFQRASLLKVAQGITSLEEVVRELPAEYLGLEA
jgi:type II secretory ATPase GspE/PulE/Tfp pilus assembly ATPase PilB-like protein